MIATTRNLSAPSVLSRHPVIRCSGERSAWEAAEGDCVRCQSCREFAREGEMTVYAEGNLCPTCHEERQDRGVEVAS